MDNIFLEDLWNKVLNKLPDDALRKLNDLKEEDINQKNIYKIIRESGINFEQILFSKEANGKVEQ